jgi:hypothetical protein
VRTWLRYAGLDIAACAAAAATSRSSTDGSSPLSWYSSCSGWRTAQRHVQVVGVSRRGECLGACMIMDCGHGAGGGSPVSPLGVRRCCRPLCGEKPWWLRCCQWPRPKAIASAERSMSELCREWRPNQRCARISDDVPLLQASNMVTCA